MAEQLDPSEIVDLRELLMSGVIQSEALINLLDRKGIITKQELLEEMKRVKATLPKSERAESNVSKNKVLGITSNKPRPALTEEDAQNIVNDYMEQQKPRRGIYRITDVFPVGCRAYNDLLVLDRFGDPGQDLSILFVVFASPDYDRHVYRSRNFLHDGYYFTG